MKQYTVDLKLEYGMQGGSITAYVADFPWDSVSQCSLWKRPAVVIVPGGGYSMVSKREGEPVALEFLSRGFHAFVLEYSTGGEDGIAYPEQLFQLAAAVDYIKKHAKECNVNPDEVFVVGFSAGGHLAGNLAIEYAQVSQKLGKNLDCKPTAIGLGYPVISAVNGHMRSYENLLAGYTDEAKTELLKTLNLDNAVSKQTPPAFLFTTAKDTSVPPDNTLRFALALNRAGVDYELHVYPRCNHGKSTGRLEVNHWTQEDAYQHKRLSKWLDDCADFFRLYIEEKF